MHVPMAGNSLRSRGLPRLPCACANLRRAARAVTQLYDAALRGSGVRMTQFSLLQFLAMAGQPITQGTLGDLLAIDSTTLSRTLKPLEQAKWIRRGSGEDGRKRHLELTNAGRRVLQRATPAWERVQRRLREGLGQRHWEALGELTTTAAETAGRL